MCPDPFLLQLEEMALSDNAILCLTAIIQRFSELEHTEDEFKEIIQHTLLDSLRKGLKSKIEVKSLALLGFVL